MSTTIDNQSQDPIVETPPTSVDATESTTDSALDSSAPVEQQKKPLPSLKDLPSLVSKDAFANTNVGWGPNMKPVVPTQSQQSLSAGSSSNSIASAKRMKSKNIQETFTLDLQSQLAITKLELSRIVLAIKQKHDVSVESTLSKNSRTFLISGLVSNVQAAKRELVKNLTRPINDSVQVPSKCKAAIIGAGGKTIREISNTYEVKINVAKEPIENSYDEDLDDDSTEVSLYGDFESVNQAKRRIAEIVREETKNATIRFTIEDSVIVPFFNLSNVEGIPSSVKVQYFNQSGDVVISGLREDAKLAKELIKTYLQKLSNSLTEQKVKIPSKFQFLISADELKEKFGTVVTFPTAPNDEFVTFAGDEDKVKEAIEYARSSSKTFSVDSLDISKAHSKNVKHARNLALYFAKYNGLSQLEAEHPDIKINLPTAAELEANKNVVNINICAKTENVAEIKVVRKEIIAVVNNISPFDTLSITDLDYELFHKTIKHILLATEADVPFIQLGDYYKNDDEVVLFSSTSTEEFKPSAEEIKKTLDDVNSKLDALRAKQNNMTNKVYNLAAATQDELFGESSVTLPLILDDVAHEEGHIQFKLHTPSNDELTLRGDEKAVKVANKAIQSIIENPSKKSTLVVEVPGNTVARLIGNKGSNMQQICERFDCSMDIPQQESKKKDDKTPVEITLTGVEYNLIHAKKLVLAEAKKWADIISMELVVPLKLHRNLIGPNGIYRNRLQEKYSVYIDFPREREIVTVRGPSRGVKQAYEELNNLLEFERENGHKLQIQVPAEHVPRVIGKNGDVINDIRDEFGVQMDFLQKNGDQKVKETGVVDLEITGTRTAIKEASARVEQIVKDAADFTTETLNVPQKYHREIVGAGGRTLREIVSSAGGDDIKNKNIDVPNSSSDSDVITIQGPKSFVSKVVKSINKIVQDGENSVSKEIDISRERYGALIGPGGVIRRQLETDFKVTLHVPNKNEDGKVTINGLPENVSKAEKKILNEILKDDFDVEIQVPASIHEYVSERGALIQKLRMDDFVNVRHHNSSRRATKLNRSKLDIPVEEVRPSEEEAKQLKTKVTIKEVGEPRVASEEGDIPWRLTYEPIDFSLIEEEKEEGDEAKKSPETKIDEEKKNAALAKATKTIEERIANAATATYAGYVWVADARRFNKVVGPGGSNIKKIREATGVLINIPRRNDPINDVVYIRGTKEGVEKATEMVTTSMKN